MLPHYLSGSRRRPRPEDSAVLPNFTWPPPKQQKTLGTPQTRLSARTAELSALEAPLLDPIHTSATGSCAEGGWLDAEHVI